MDTNKLEKKMKRLYKNVKAGRVTEEIAEEISSAMEDFEELGSEAKERFGDMVHEMKDVVDRMSKH